MLKNFIIIVFLVLDIISSCQAENILLLTDIHFNPYSKCSKIPQTIPCSKLKNLIENPVEKWSIFLNQESINNFKEETNNAFLIQGIDRLAPIADTKAVKIILITGDLLSHGFDDYYRKLAPTEYNTQLNLTNFTYKTSSYVLQTLHNKLPNSKIYMVLGNNDSDYGDYQIPSTNFLESMAVYLSDFVVNKKEFITTFSHGGYFSTPLTNKITLIGINTNILSSIHSDFILAQEQLNWLKLELSKAALAKKKVILFQHVPYGLDLYKTATSLDIQLLLNATLQTEYLHVLNQYSSLITTIYTGHYHAEYLAIINSIMPLIGSLALNSMFGNNPGFKIVGIDSNGDFAGYTTYYSDLANGQVKWSQLYNFTQLYGQPYKIVTMLNQFPFNLTESMVVNYRKYFNGNNVEYPQSIALDKNWKYYYCGIKHIQAKKFTNCVESASFFYK